MRELVLVGFLAISLSSFSQCEIYNRLASDGSMLYYMDPTVLYWSSSKELQGNIVSNKSTYFLGLQPIPFPAKPIGMQLNDKLEVTLANQKKYLLDLYDIQYLDDESIMQFLYVINKNDLPEFVNKQIIDIKINLGKEEGIRFYSITLHKKTLQEQLSCFLKEDKK
ncbi:MAG: hypothetical protein WCX31_00370 [Salinivirgaceae bacterium]|jgi:hypothetical protein